MNPNDDKTCKSNWTMVEGNEWMNVSMNYELETCNLGSMDDLECTWIQEWSGVWNPMSTWSTGYVLNLKDQGTIMLDQMPQGKCPPML